MSQIYQGQMQGQPMYQGQNYQGQMQPMYQGQNYQMQRDGQLSRGTKIFIGVVVTGCVVGLLGLLIYKLTPKDNDSTSSTTTSLPNLVTSALPNVRPPSYSKLSNADIWGNDLAAFSGTLDRCKSYCNDTPNCLSFTRSSSFADDVSGVCQMKSSNTISNANAPAWNVWKKN